jgi:hypothetical protein
MNYYENGNYLIVHGGRNDSSLEKYSLNDTYIFDLGKFEWAYVKFFYESSKMEVLKRFGHAAIIHCKKYYTYDLNF